MTEREIIEGAEALKELARIGRGIPLSIVEAREGARAVLRAAERVRVVGEDMRSAGLDAGETK